MSRKMLILLALGFIGVNRGALASSGNAPASFAPGPVVWACDGAQEFKREPIPGASCAAFPVQHGQDCMQNPCKPFDFVIMTDKKTGQNIVVDVK